jgi:ferritin
MKKFTFLLKESENKYSEVLDAIKEMVESTIEKSGGEYDTFLDSFIKDPEGVKIEGLINESDIYDFYLKYRNQIDEVLNDVKFYQTPPEENNVFGLYDFVIRGTQKSIEEFVKIMIG